MALNIIKNINIDFYDDKYTLINAKQYDGNSRYVTITCYNQGKIFNLNPSKHTAYVRYKKSDGHTIFDFCTITPKGQIEMELTEQMLASSGVCDVDLVVIHKGNAVVNVDTGEIITIDDSSIISTMLFRVYVYEPAIDNTLVESSDEYNGLNDLLTRAEADYKAVIEASEHHALMSESWAIGGTGIEGRADEDTNNSEYHSQMSKSWAVGHTEDDVRSGEDTDNAQWYSGQSESWAIGGTGNRDGEDINNAQWFSSQSESWAVGDTGNRDGEDTDNAQYYSQMSKSYAMGGTGIDARKEEDVDNAEYYSRLAKSYTMGSFDGSTETRDDEGTENAKTYMETAKSHMDDAKEHMDNAKSHMDDAKEYMNNAKISETNAKASEDASALSEANASLSETNALNSANKAQSYTVGGTGTRVGEDTDNASWYYNEMKDMFNGLNIVFVPKGTISFDELATAKETAVAGYVYNIKDDFVTDETFREGAGMTYTAGTNIYYTIDGAWDCFGGSASPTATVDEVKEYLGI